jgi:hypothetical protein
MALVPEFEVELIVDYVMGSDDYNGSEFETFRRREEEQSHPRPDEMEAEI